MIRYYVALRNSHETLHPTFGGVPLLEAIATAEASRRDGFYVDLVRIGQVRNVTVAALHPEGDVNVGTACTPEECGNLLNAIVDLRSSHLNPA